MCLKQTICKDISLKKYTLKDIEQKEKLLRYEIVRQQGIYNILDDEARDMTGLSKKDYIYIIKNYSQLIDNYSSIREEAFEHLQYIKLNNASNILAKNGCSNCIINNRLDVITNNLCDTCKRVAQETS